MAGGGIRDELLDSIKCPQKACVSPQPLLAKSPPEAFMSRGFFVTNSGGTRASGWRPESNQLWVYETHSPGRQLA